MDDHEDDENEITMYRLRWEPQEEQREEWGRWTKTSRQRDQLSSGGFVLHAVIIIITGNIGKNISLFCCRHLVFGLWLPVRCFAFCDKSARSQTVDLTVWDSHTQVTSDTSGTSEPVPEASLGEVLLEDLPPEMSLCHRYWSICRHNKLPILWGSSEGAQEKKYKIYTIFHVLSSLVTQYPFCKARLRNKSESYPFSE